MHVTIKYNSRNLNLLLMYPLPSFQLAAMEQIGGGQQGSSQPDVERGRAFGNLGTCYDSLGDYEEGVKVGFRSALPDGKI